MYFFWQAAFSILLWSNTDSRVKLLKGSIPPHQCAAPWKCSLLMSDAPHYYLLFAFYKGGAGHFLSMPGGLEPPLCFILRMNDTMEAHPLPVRGMGE